MIKSIGEEIENNEKIKKCAVEKQEKINDKRYKKLLNKRNDINQKYLDLALETKDKKTRNKYFKKYKKESEKTNKLLMKMIKINNKSIRNLEKFYDDKTIKLMTKIYTHKKIRSKKKLTDSDYFNCTRQFSWLKGTRFVFNIPAIKKSIKNINNMLLESKKQSMKYDIEIKKLDWEIRSLKSLEREIKNDKKVNFH